MISVMTTSGKRTFPNQEILEATFPKSKFKHIEQNGKIYIVFIQDLKSSYGGIGDTRES